VETLGTQDTGHQRQWKWGTQDKIGQTRDSRNMGYTRQERTNQRQWKHGVHKTQDKKKTMSNTITTKNGGTCEGYTVPVS
jgi:hypothetical protein